MKMAFVEDNLIIFYVCIRKKTTFVPKFEFLKLK